MWEYLFKIFLLFSLVNGEEYNLIGDVGQAYPIDTQVGTPKKSGNLELAFEAIDAQAKMASSEDHFNPPLPSVPFELKLCGHHNFTNTHVGKILLFANNTENATTPQFLTPILHEHQYEVGVVDFAVFHVKADYTDLDIHGHPTFKPLYPCSLSPPQSLKLTKESIVDSGTANIKLQDVLFKWVVDTIRDLDIKDSIPSLDFWYMGEMYCWAEPQDFETMPWLSISLIDAERSNSYFTLQISPKKYIRFVLFKKDDGVGQYCYRFGLERGGKKMVLGYTAMEGLKVTFNRSANWIGFSTSDCGPFSPISGPFEVSYPIVDSQILEFDDLYTELISAFFELSIASFILDLVSTYIIYLILKSIYFTLFPEKNTE